MYGQPSVRPGFSMSDLVSEEALPEWLRQASAESAQPTQHQPVPGGPGGPGGQGAPAYSPPQAYPPAYPPVQQPPAPAYGSYAAMPTDESPYQRPDANAFPGIESAGSYQGPFVGGGGMPASSLLDPNALPTWLGGQQGQATADPLRGGEGMRAQSLVDDSALPGWLRNEPASPIQTPAAPPPVAVPGWEGYSAASQMPPRSPGVPAAIPGAPGAMSAGYAGMQQQQQPPQIPMGGQPGLSASQLIDPNALPAWMQAQGGAGVQQPAASAQQGWSASDLIDPSMLPGWVRGNDAAAPQAGVPQAGVPNSPMRPMGPVSDSNLARERTGRVPAPREATPTAESDFGVSRVGTSQRGAVSRKQPAARPLGEEEKPVWLREGPPDGNGGGRDDRAAAYPSGRQDRNSRGQNSYNGYDDYGEYGENGVQNGRTSQRGRMPANGRTGQSRAAPDGYETSRRGYPQPTRQHGTPPEKKRKGGFFGFLRRG